MRDDDHTGDQHDEQPAKRLLGALGWSGAHPHPGPLPGGEGVWVEQAGLFGRERKGEGVDEKAVGTTVDPLANVGRVGLEPPVAGILVKTPLSPGGERRGFNLSAGFVKKQP
ncbi:MAG: hypothetical protein NTZ16_03305 [Verrucomicrobia bacterium]|nr:hypothetical protein [Verrucomicrobiota bacterium]